MGVARMTTSGAVSGGQQLVQGSKDGHGSAQPAILRRMGIRDGHEFDGAGRLQPGQVGQVPFAEAVDTHQGDPRPGSRSRGRAASASSAVLWCLLL